MELFIPARMNKDDKYGKGIGKEEMKRILKVVAFGIALGLIVGICFFSDKINFVLISACFGGGVFFGIGYGISQKNSINLSPYHYLNLLISFFKSQQIFVYKKRKEWCVT